MLKLLARLLVLLVLLAAGWVVRLFYVAGELRQLEPVSPGVCTAVEGIVGAEDIVIDRPSKTALISAYDRRAAEAGEEVRGAIYAYDLVSRDLRELPVELGSGLQPHGMGLYPGASGARLFVVNHGAPAGNGHSVEIFAFESEALRHLETVQGDALVSPNDVLAVGPTRFYATNDHGSTKGYSRIAEEYLQLAQANVVYYDGASFSVAARGIAFANGIGMSPFGREVYVASSTRMKIHLYARDPESGELTAVETIPLGTGPDNLHVDRHGMLWIAAHPKLLTYTRHARNAARRSPSHVVWLDPDQTYEPPIRDVYLGDGTELSGSSVAVPWGNRLLIGSVYEHFLDCERG